MKRVFSSITAFVLFAAFTLSAFNQSGEDWQWTEARDLEVESSSETPWSSKNIAVHWTTPDGFESDFKPYLFVAYFLDQNSADWLSSFLSFSTEISPRGPPVS